MKLFLMSFIGTLLLGCASFSTDINAVPDTGEVNSSAVRVAQNDSLVIEKSEVDLLEISLPLPHIESFDGVRRGSLIF